MSLLPVILMCVAPAQFPESVVDDASRSSRTRPYHPGWLLEASVGAENPVSDAAAWLDGVGEPAAALRLHYSLDRFVPGLFAHAGVGLWDRGELGAGAASLSLLVSEVELGATWQWPRHGLWDFVFPYVRASVLLGYWRLRAGDLGGDVWLQPGLRGVIGLRMHLGQLLERGAVSSRLYLFGEGGFAGRLSSRPRLTLLDDEDDSLLTGVPTRLGALNLSGWSWSVGLGFAF